MSICAHFNPSEHSVEGKDILGFSFLHNDNIPAYLNETSLLFLV